MADRRAQHLLVLRIEPGFQGADGVGPAFGAHASPGQAGLVIMRRPSAPGRCRGLRGGALDPGGHAVGIRGVERIPAATRPDPDPASGDGLARSWSMSWKRPEQGTLLRLRGRAGARGAGVKTSPMSTVPEPPITTLPCAPILPSVTAGRPLMSTVDETAEIIGLPQAEVSPCRAAGGCRKRRRESPGRWGCCHALALGRSLDR